MADLFTLPDGRRVTPEQVAALLPEALRQFRERSVRAGVQAGYDAAAKAYAQAGYDAAVRHFMATGELVRGTRPAVVKNVIRDDKGQITAIIEEGVRTTG